MSTVTDVVAYVIINVFSRLYEMLAFPFLCEPKLGAMSLINSCIESNNKQTLQSSKLTDKYKQTYTGLI